MGAGLPPVALSSVDLNVDCDDAIAGTPAPLLCGTVIKCMSYHCVFPLPRLIAMTAATDTLLNVLEGCCGMVEIDGLHAGFEFSSMKTTTCISNAWTVERPGTGRSPGANPGRDLRQHIAKLADHGDSGEHRLVCLGDVIGGDNDDDDEDDENEDA